MAKEQIKLSVVAMTAITVDSPRSALDGTTRLKMHYSVPDNKQMMQAPTSPTSVIIIRPDDVNITTPAMLNRPLISSMKKSSSSNHTRKKSVDFSSNDTINLTISRKEITEDEKKNSWVSEDEHLSIRQRCHKIIRKVEKAGAILHDGRKICTRGLEGHYQKQSRRKLINRFHTQEEVLSEQKDQSSRGFYDDEKIAEAYTSMGITYTAALSASLIALKDQEEANMYHSQT